MRRRKHYNSSGRKRISACGPLGYHTAKTEEAVKGAKRSSRPLTLLFLDYDGIHQFCLQAVLHVLINTDVRQTIFVIKRSRTNFVDVAVVVPQDVIQCQWVTCTGGFNHVHEQKHSAVKSWLFHISFSLLWISSFFAARSVSLFCAAGRRCGTIPQNCPLLCLVAPARNAELKSAVRVPANRQKHLLLIRSEYTGHSQTPKTQTWRWGIRLLYKVHPFRVGTRR